MKTQAPNKGDLVVGHRAVAFFADRKYSVGGKIVDVSKSGHSVVFQTSAFMAALGLPRRTRWTWRRSVNAYQQAGTPTKKGAGLALRKDQPQ